MTDQTRHSKWSIPRHRRRRVGIGLGAVATVAVAGTALAFALQPGDGTSIAATPTGSTQAVTAAPTETCTPQAAAPTVATLTELEPIVNAAANDASCAFTSSVAAPTNDAWWFGAQPETDVVQAVKPQLVESLATTELVVVTDASAPAPTSWGETIAAGTVAVDMRRGSGVHPALRDAVLAELLATGANEATALTQVAGIAQRLGPTNPTLTTNDETFAAVDAGAVSGLITTEAAWSAYEAAHPDTTLVARVPASGSAPVALGLWQQGECAGRPCRSELHHGCTSCRCQHRRPRAAAHRERRPAPRRRVDVD